MREQWLSCYSILAHQGGSFGICGMRQPFSGALLPKTPTPSPLKATSNAPQGPYTIPASRENTRSIVIRSQIPQSANTALSDALKGLTAADRPWRTASLCANPTKPCHAKKQVDSGPTCLTRQVLVPPHRPPWACDSANKVPTRKSQAQRPAQSPTDGKISTHFPNKSSRHQGITPSQCPHRPSVQGGKSTQISAPGRIRTCDTWFRKPLLYPLSYGGTDRW